jgi:Mce-associated membrane protein
VTDETTTPPERSWSGETGWPAADAAPSWADPGAWEESAEQDAYDEWLDAQAPPEVDEEPVGAAPLPAAPLPAADVLDDELVQEREVPVEQRAEAEEPAVPGTRPAASLVVALVVLVVLLAVLAGFLGARSVSSRAEGPVGDARRDALAAARNAARLVFSYDYRHLEKDFAAGKAVTTGTFAADYQRTTSRLVDDVAAKYKAVVVADVSDAAVVTAGKNRVVTIIFLNQQSTSTLKASQEITQSRITMVMVRKNGQWLVSEVKAF